MGKGVEKSDCSTSKEEIDYKHVTNRIDRIQKHCSELAKVLTVYTTKSAIIRDKNDEIAKCLAKYTEIEDFNTTSKLAMSVAAELFAKVGDHQTVAVQRLEMKVVPNFSSYGRICKCLKADVRNASAAQERVLSRRKMATTFSERMNEPKYRDVITDAERELENAMAESARLGILSEEQVIKFEHKHLIDLKETLENFFKIEIARHAKSIELLTDAYKYIHSIDEDADLEALKAGLKLREVQPINCFNKQLHIKFPHSKEPVMNDSKEVMDGDNSWNSESVRKLQEIMTTPSPLDRTSTRTPKNSVKKSGSRLEHYAQDRNRSEVKSPESNTKNEMAHKSDESNIRNRKKNQRDRGRSEDADNRKNPSSREFLEREQVHQTSSDYTISNDNKCTPQRQSNQKPERAKYSNSNKSVERVPTSDKASLKNHADIRRSYETGNSAHKKYRISKLQEDATGGNGSISSKKVTFLDERENHDETNRMGTRVDDDAKYIQVSSKSSGRKHTDKRSTESGKYTPENHAPKNQFL